MPRNKPAVSTGLGFSGIFATENYRHLKIIYSFFRSQAFFRVDALKVLRIVFRLEGSTVSRS
jgi:hypothetical protein